MKINTSFWTSDLQNYTGSCVLPKAKLPPPHKAAYILFAFSGVSNSFHKLSTSWSFFSLRTCRQNKNKTTQLHLKHFWTIFKPAFSTEDLKQIYSIPNCWKLIQQIQLIQPWFPVSPFSLSNFTFIIASSIQQYLQYWIYLQLHYRSCSIMAGFFWTRTIKAKPSPCLSKPGLLYHLQDSFTTPVTQNQTCLCSGKIQTCLGHLTGRSDPTSYCHEFELTQGRKRMSLDRWLFHHSSVIKWAKNYLRGCNGLIPALAKGDLLSVFKKQKNNNYSPRSYTHFIKRQVYCKFLEKCSGEQHGQDPYNITFFNTSVKNIVVLLLQLRSNTTAIWLSAVQKIVPGITRFCSLADFWTQVKEGRIF